jgi:hypothetical protein
VFCIIYIEPGPLALKLFGPPPPPPPRQQIVSLSQSSGVSPLDPTDWRSGRGGIGGGHFIRIRWRESLVLYK